MSDFEFKLPDIGEGIVEGEVVKWLKRVGDVVNEDEPLLEIMTDKATVEIVSPVKGKILSQSTQEGHMIKVGALVAKIETQGKDNVVPIKDKIETQETITRQSIQEPVKAVYESSAIQASPSMILASPATRKLARENNINLSKVTASGQHGRVLKEDVLNFVNVADNPRQEYSSLASQRVPLKGLRKVIAQNMLRSKQFSAHFTHVDEVDMTRLIEVREKINTQLQSEGIKISYLPFLIKAVCVGLKKYPRINASLDEASMELIYKNEYNIGIAMATKDDDLLVPIVKHADQKSIKTIAQDILELSNKNQNSKLTQSDFKDGTFTITSLGTMAGLHATPIINYPELGILGFYRIQKRPVVINDQVEIRSMANISITLNHRIVDGLMGANFLRTVIDVLENPELLLIG